MKKIKDKIKIIIEKTKKVFEHYPVTMIAIFFATIFLAIFEPSDILESKVIENVMLFCITFGCGDFLIETIFKKKDKKKVMYYILSAVLAVILVLLLNIENDVFSILNAVFVEYIQRFLICYNLLTVITGVYISLKNSNLDFNEYVVRVAINIFRVGIIYMILAIGLALITSVFIYLILDTSDYDLIERIEILVFGLYFIPGILGSLYDLKNEIGKFAKVVIKYVLDILVIIAFLILYLYIGKIIILQDMPSNQIFRILAALFVIGCPVWTLASYFKDEDVLNKVNKKLPLFFIPFIVLQIYTIGVRIYHNGVTEPRYLCIMLIILEIAYILLYILKREKIENILIVLNVVIAISTIIPYVNMYKVSELNQLSNLKMYKEKAILSESEEEKVKGAYYYLKSLSNGNQIINEVLTKDDIEKITSFEGKTSNIVRIYANETVESMYIEGYKEIYLVDISDYSTDISIEDTFTRIPVGDYEINLVNLIKDYLAHDEDIDEYFEENNIVDLDDKTKIVIEQVSLSYDSDSNVLESYYIEGYLLVK